MADIVPTLFGLTPEAYQQQQAQAADRMALEYAQLTPMQQAQFAIGRGAYQLAGALGGALGGQDPILQMISARQAVAKEVDLSDRASIMSGVQKLSRLGDIEGQKQLLAAADMAAKRTAQALEYEDAATRRRLESEARESAQLAQQIAKGAFQPGKQVMEQLPESTVGTDALGPAQVAMETAPTFDVSKVESQLLAMGPAGRAELQSIYDLLQKQGRLTEQQAAQRRGALTVEREEKLASELNQLPADATEEQLLTVLRRYGDPKQVTQALERRFTVQAQLAEQRRMAAEREQFRREQMEKDQEFKRDMARLQAQLQSGTTDLRRQLIQAQIDSLTQKKQDAIDRQLGSAEGVVQSTQIVLGKLDEADKLISKSTTGFGSYLSVVPGTKAKQLGSVIATIKARLGFDQLQQMRNASPTGGALGQVAVKELEALQSAIASLDQSLDADALKKNVAQIRQSYKNWQNAALGKLPARPTQPPADGNVVDYNSLKQ